MPRFRTALLLALPPLAFLGVFLVAPAVRLLLEGFSGDSSANLSSLLTPYFLGKLLWTLSSALLTAFLCLLLGLPAAYALARYRFWGKAALERALLLPFVVPAPVAALGWLALFGPRGLSGVDLQDSAALVILGYLFYNLALSVRLLRAGFSRLDTATLEAARLLGAPACRRFWGVALPQLAPAIGSSAGLTFLYCFSAFGLPLLLGGQRYGTLEVEIYRLIAFQLELGQAGLLACVQLLVSGLAVWTYARLERAAPPSGRARPLLERPTHGPLERLGLLLVFAPVVLLSFAPLLAVLVRSVVGRDGLTLRFYAGLASSDTGPTLLELARNTLAFSMLATLLALLLGGLHALAVWTLEGGGRRQEGRAGLQGTGDRFQGSGERADSAVASAVGESPSEQQKPSHALTLSRSHAPSGDPARTAPSSTALDLVTLLPLMTSPALVSLGYLLLYPDLTAGLALLIAVYALFAMPLVARALLPALRGLNRNALEAARLLGVSNVGLVARLALPAVWPALRGGLALALAACLGEFASTLVLSRPEWSTLTLGIFERLGRPGEQNLGEAMALSSALLTLSMGCFWLVRE